MLHLARTTLMLGVTTLITSLTGAAERYPDVTKLPICKELPDPLTMLDGTKITNKDDWNSKRKPELQALFQHYMYGKLPPRPDKVQGKVLHEDSAALAGKAILREVALSWGDGKAPPIYLLIVLPKVTQPVPVFVGINFCGNHSLVDDPKVHIPENWIYDRYPGVKGNRATEEGRGKQKDVWNIDLIVERGYGLAVFYNGDVDPDRADKREGIRPFLPTDAKDEGDGTGTIAAWAWGVHRAVDFLVTDPMIDAKRLICVGHSRLGKTALLATAFDSRIAMGIPHQAGCGGTAPSRGTIGESVKQINDRFPHWFCANFKRFNAEPSRLPFDQHSLVALCAPRPILFSNAVEDTWANPSGQFEVLKAAEPVYKLLGAGGLDAKEMPPPGKLIASTLGYFIREGKHSMTREDWKAYLDFADKHLGKK